MHRLTLGVDLDAECLAMHSHAERGNNHADSRLLILAGGRRSALALGRTRTIYRAAVAKSGDSVVPDTPHAPDLLPVPGRSRARWNATPVAPTPSAESKAELLLLLLMLLLLLFLPRQPRHHKTRLGCRLNAGVAEWDERHGCRESRPPPWMADGGGPTERRRSEGTSTKSRPNRKPTLGYLGLSSNPPKAERFCR
jgi:hypothetical protein